MTKVAVRFTVQVGAGAFARQGSIGARSVGAAEVAATKVQVTSWASAGVKPVLTSGKWVQLGKPTVWNFIKTGLPGAKYYPGFSKHFPWILTRVASNVPFRNYITGFVEQSSLMWPKGWQVVKGIIGQRMIK